MRGIGTKFDRYDAADEMPWNLATVRKRSILLDDVLPKIFLLLGFPAVVTLVQRNPKLAVLSPQVAERSFSGLRSPQDSRHRRAAVQEGRLPLSTPVRSSQH
nr:hypothetical protein [Mycolicibacter senuensis]